MEFNRRNFLASASMAAPLMFSPGIARAKEGVIKPKRLAPGNTIGIISPASITFNSTRLEIVEESLAALDLKIKTGKHALDRWGYFAGKDEDRASDINEMFGDDNIDAIFALTGGWGCARLLPLLDYERIRKNPKILMGFSDVTALLIGIFAKSNLVTFHGPTGNSTWNPFTVDYMRRILFDGEMVTMKNPVDFGDNLTQTKDRIRTITPGKAKGKLVGGNLTVLTTIIGSGYLPDWKGSILFLEDLNESIYRVDRMLTQLHLAGVFDNLAGIVFGKCSDCDPKSHYSGFTLEEVLIDHFKLLGIPVFHGSMIGHIKQKFTVPVGIDVEIDADNGTITMLEQAVI